MTARKIARRLAAVPASDGAGVKLKRSLGQSQLARLDPFLMLDEFFSDQPEDYLAGFPSHPHRGFETVTYMLDGHMLHEDHMGNRGDLRPGDVQWMTAGRGVIHSEMPQQTEGRMRGFQLWINLHSSEKMQPAAYRDIPADQLTRHEFENGTRVVHIAGRTSLNGQSSQGAVNGLDGRQLSSDPLYLDIELPAGNDMDIAITPGYNALVYLYEGNMTLGDEVLGSNEVAVSSDGDSLRLQGGDGGGRALVLAGKPFGEPVAQYGPFVMNSSAEIEQALRDYRDGALTADQ
ncbi:pirin family protein [Spongiibacter nanhainus]|uniref:Pirin family protein n=1 Tax=Spongiibacter nanhainus TaxID=2794344 RepID=A0A7T4UQC6_9GAMM|nr:pirin family protein [Spongiibacter nanhainus]QQD18337.1 pirin family protein [Spongiibacter nanhainus]